MRIALSTASVSTLTIALRFVLRRFPPNLNALDLRKEGLH
jgi:hypothetical protein